MSWPTNANTSATGGLLIPAAPAPFPNGVSFEEFFQTVLAGVSGLSGSLVRPKWQINPPKQPDVGVNWLAFGLADVDADKFAYVGTTRNGQNSFQRMELIEAQCSFYGPDSLEYARLVRDAFQIKQNLELLESQLITFVEASRAIRVPDLVNERWVDRWNLSLILRRQINRVYPITTFLSGSGTLIANNEGGTTIEVPISITEDA